MSVQAEPIPQPRTRPLVGNAPDIGFDVPVQNMMKLARELGPIYRLAFPGGSITVISSHELVNDACDETRFEKFVHGTLKHIRSFAGDGLFMAYGNEPNWAKAHRLLMPAFGPQAMRVPSAWSRPSSFPVAVSHIRIARPSSARVRNLAPSAVKATSRRL